MEIKNFTAANKEPRKFQIDDDIFECAYSIPAGVGAEMIRIQHLKPDEMFDQIGHILDMIMLPASAEVFARRMTDPTNPITIDHIGEVFAWLTSEYAGRPTVPPGNWQPPPSTDGTNSMDGVQPMVLPA